MSDLLKAKDGRPSKYKPEYCQLLIDHMSKGLSFETFGAVINVNRDTIFEWVKVHKDFSDAKIEAIAKCQLFWENLGVEHILNVTKSQSEGGVTKSGSKSLNASVWIFNMKNRFKWRDKQVDENDTINVNVSLADRISKARSRVGK